MFNMLSKNDTKYWNVFTDAMIAAYDTNVQKIVQKCCNAT